MTDVATRVRVYRTTQSPAVLSELLAQLTPLVRQVTALYDRGETREELQCVGYLVLITAVTQYDPDRGVPLAAFARDVISREIRRYLQGHTTPVLRPRWLHHLDGRIRAAVGMLVRRLGRLPTLAEIAHEVNVAEQGVLEVLRSLPDSELTERSIVRRERIRHHHYVSFRLPIEDRIRVAEAVERLSVLRRKIVLFLSIDRAQTEVVRRLLVSQRHVSGTMHEAVVRLRDILGPPRVLGPPSGRTVV